MTAAAVRSGRRLRGANSRPALHASLAALTTLWPIAAHAQLGAAVSVYSDDRFRGVSLSDRRPVAILDLSYDAAEGMYAALSGSLVATRGEGLQPLGVTVNGGYARRLRSGTSLDLGVAHSQYSHYSGLGGARSYTEVYAGVSGRTVGARLSVSPNYLGAAHWTLHGAVNAHKDLSKRLFLDGELGILVPVGSGAYSDHLRPEFDARVGIARKTGPVTLHAAATARGGPYAYAGRSHGPIALVLGISGAL